MGKDQGRASARRLIMMGVHVIGTAVQDEGDAFAPRSSAKTHWYLEQAEGYVKVLEKSTSRFSTMRGGFEHRAQNA